MIIFHEGLPGSGKSYEACVNRITEALKKGRKVFTNIEGINRSKYAEILEITEEKSAELLVDIQEDKIRTVQDHVENDSLVVIDEIQDYFPATRQKMEEGITRFVTQHRHRGIDIILMGQDHRDCHNLWKRRIDQLVHFVKRDAVGMPNDYTWTTYKARNGKFVKLRSGKGTYEKQYFGLYKSHVDGANNLETYSDDRANVLKSPGMKYGAIAVIVALVGSIYVLRSFFNGDMGVVDTQVSVKKEQEQEQVKPKKLREVSIQSAQYQEKKEKPKPEIDYIGDMGSRYRLRLAGIAHSDEKMFYRVDVLDSSFRRHESFTQDDILSLGWVVERYDYGLLLKKGKKKLIVRGWPLDYFGRVSKEVRNSPDLKS